VGEGRVTVRHRHLLCRTLVEGKEVERQCCLCRGKGEIEEGGEKEGRGGGNGPWWKDACGKNLFEGTDLPRSHMLAQWEGDGRIRRPGVEGRI
jgi:hypothetical protein